MKEIWKPIKDWEDAYLVSNLGRVFSIKYNKPIAVRVSNHGYCTADLFTRRKGVVRRKKIYVHREVAKCFVSNPENKEYVDHIDADKTNNVYTNLQWVTNAENVKKGYLQNKEYRACDKFKKQPVYINTKPIVYFDSITECAKSLGLPRERLKTVLRFFDGKLPELGIQIFRCNSGSND